MFNVILYDEDTIVRVAQRAVKVFSNYTGFRTTKNAIWLKGMYLKFAPRMLILNVFDSSIISEDEIKEILKNVLLGEEVYVSDNFQFQKYINKVDALTDFKVVSDGDSL